MAGTSANITWFIAFTAYLSYLWLFGFGYIRDFWRKYFPSEADEKKPDDPNYAPIVADFEDFYRRRVYARTSDAFFRPITSAPSAYIDVWQRTSNDNNKTLTLTEPRETVRCLNLGSYNYLGFSQPPEYVTKSVLKDLEHYGVSCTSAYLEYGFTSVHKELEQVVARYVGMEDSFIIGMGFATNTTVIPTLAGKVWYLKLGFTRFITG
jgi:serine palmitoyltransferase